MKRPAEEPKKEKNYFFIGNDYGDFLDTKYEIAVRNLELMVSTKVSVEKYMKKLKHQGE